MTIKNLPAPRLSFDTLRAANIARMPQFKNPLGLPAHSEPDGSDWSLSDWLQAVLGELGEYANIAKKYLRGDISLEEFRQRGGRELADTVTYLDILAWRAGLDLGWEVRRKFNEVSDRCGSSVIISGDCAIDTEASPSVLVNVATNRTHPDILDHIAVHPLREEVVDLGDSLGDAGNRLIAWAALANVPALTDDLRAVLKIAREWKREAGALKTLQAALVHAYDPKDNNEPSIVFERLDPFADRGDTSFGVVGFRLRDVDTMGPEATGASLVQLSDNFKASQE